MFTKLKYGALAALLAAGAFSTATVKADAISDFYKGKTLTLVFGYGVGGTYGK